MDVLVTGATGKVGFHIVDALLRRGDTVRALVRNPGQARSILPPDVQLSVGDVTQVATLENRGLDDHGPRRP